MRRSSAFVRLAFVATTTVMLTNRAWSEEIACKNPGNVVYNRDPAYKAPDDTRGVGLRVTVKSHAVPVPDLRPQCLPIAVRYNNYGVLKTPNAGPWPGQITRDKYGHAVFANVGDGMAAWAIWIAKRTASAPKSAFELMSLYAPPDDCVGSIGTPPDCPYGINPTLDYATRIAAAVHKGPHDKLTLDTKDCGEGREALYAVFVQVATFEISSTFCGGLCLIDRGIFNDALNRASGSQCAGASG